MKKTVKIEGMMCIKCEGKVQKMFDEMEGITKAKVSHKKGTAEIEVADTVTDEMIKNAVEELGYKVTSIEEKKGFSIFGK